MIARPSGTVSTYRSTILREAVLLGPLAAAFLGLMAVVVADAPTGLDTWLAGRIQAIPWGHLSVIPRLGSDIGGGVYGTYLAPAAIAIVLGVRRQWRVLALLVAMFALHYLLISPKLFVTAYRPSPLFGVEGAGGLESFPSGHVQWASSFYGFAGYLIARGRPSLRLPVVAGYTLIVAATALGRIELGRHWPIDTLAGVIVGLIALRLVILADRWWARRQESPAIPGHGATERSARTRSSLD